MIPPSHGERIARMKAKGQIPCKFKPFEYCKKCDTRGWYERFRSWLQGYAWKGFCRHWFIKFCAACDTAYCLKCGQDFIRHIIMTHLPVGYGNYDIPCKHRKGGD